MTVYTEGRFSSVCHSIDTTKIPSHFSRFPAAISIANDQVENTLRALSDHGTEPDTRARRRAQIRNTCPYGNPFAIWHASALPERLVMLGSIIEILWIQDDISEELDMDEAAAEHEKLKEVLRMDIDPSTFRAVNIRQALLCEKIREAIELDPEAGPAMLQTLRTYLETFDSQDKEFESMEQYMPYRIQNCGHWISSYFVRWGMGITLTDEEYESIREYDYTMGNIMGLTNDYFSWKVEKNQPTGRLRNGVKVLTKEYGVTDEVARRLLLAIITEEECRAVRLRQERLQQPVSDAVLRFIEAIELYVGGSCYWHATAPRYQKFE